MSTTFKRIALVAVAALGLGVVSVAPSQATVSSLTVTVTDGTAKLAGTTTTADTTTAAVVAISGLFDATTDSVTVQAVQKSVPTGASVTALLGYLETTTSANSAVTKPLVAASKFDSASVTTANFSVSRSTNAGYAGAKFTLQLDPASTTVKAGTYTYTLIVKTVEANTVKTTTTYDASIVVTAQSLLSDATSVSLLSTIGTNPSTAITAGFTTDSTTVASKAAGASEPVATIYVKQKNATSTASEEMTAVISGPGSIKANASYDATLTTAGARVVTMGATNFLHVFADGSSGVATITITGNDSGLVLAKKTVTFYDTKPASASATTKIAYVAGGTSNVLKTFVVSVKDTAGNPITALASLTGAATDTTTTVGGAVTCVNEYNATAGGYYCGVAGKSATKFGKVNYTFTATGLDAAATKVTATADVTFSSSVIASLTITPSVTAGGPGDVVTYTLTALDANGYAVPDADYNTSKQILSSLTASGFATAPFAAADTITTVSGVATSKGTLALAGTAKLTWTLAGTKGALADSSDLAKGIQGTDITVADLAISNPGVDAATDAAMEATAAAQDAADAAYSAADAADQATTAAQNAVEAVADLAAKVDEMIKGLQSQIKSLAALVAKIAKKVKA